MSDARGGRYFGPARFFLAGDKVLAQRHIGEARMLLGYMRDQMLSGGPTYQVQYTELQDGTRIKAVMNNGLFQAEVVSPIGERAVITYPEIVFIFDVLESSNHVVYRPSVGAFVVIEPLVFGVLPNQVEYTKLRNYWYGQSPDASTGVAVAEAAHAYTNVLYPGHLESGYSAAWSANANIDHKSRTFIQRVRASAVWGDKIVHLLSSGSAGFMRVYTPTNTLLTTPTGGTYNVGVAIHPARFNPAGDQAIIIKTADVPAAYVTATIAETAVPAAPFAVTYAEVSVPLTPAQSQTYSYNAGTITYLQDTSGGACSPWVIEYTQTPTIQPGISVSETLVGVGFSAEGDQRVLTDLREVYQTGATQPADKRYYESRVLSDVATWTEGAPPSVLITDTSKYTQDYVNTWTANAYVVTTKRTYKLNGEVVYVTTHTSTQSVPYGVSSLHIEQQQLGDGLSCGGSRSSPYSGPKIDPPTVPYVYETTTMDSTIQSTLTGSTSALIFHDLRAYLLAVHERLAGGGHAVAVVTSDGTVTLPLRNTAGLADSQVLFAYGAVHEGTALLHISTAYFETVGATCLGLFLVKFGSGQITAEDVTDRVPNGWTPFQITLCADKNLVEV